MGVTYRWHGDDVMKVIRKNTTKSVARAAVYTQGVMRKVLSRSGQGRKHYGMSYKSSAPGQPPTVQTGTLRRSVQADFRNLQKRNPRARVGPGVFYARFLEEGTRRMRPRPFRDLTIRKARPMILRFFGPRYIMRGLY